MLRQALVTSAVLCLAGMISACGDRAPSQGAPAANGKPAPVPAGPAYKGHCLGDVKIKSEDSRPIPGFVVIDWVMDVANSCAEPHDIRVTYQVWADGDVLLESDSQDLTIEANARVTATGRFRLGDDTFTRVTRRTGVAQFR